MYMAYVVVEWDRKGKSFHTSKSENILYPKQ